ncbi:MAG: cysteine synthase A [Clostridia bacterium]|nr:cysteine synthase A [Clostridia bacterium]
MPLYHAIEDLVGKTPLLELHRIEEEYNLAARLLVKLESRNPTSSAKDRAALQMLKDAKAAGKLPKGATIIEPTSGNTGIALAALGASWGLRVIIVMPSSMSEERKRLMRAYGAELILTPSKDGMKGAVSKAEELQRQIPDSIIIGQFSNPSNPKAHYLSTAPEIWEDTDGKIDCFVAGIGTGGTLCGSARFFKEKNQDIRIIGVEPFDSPLLTKGCAAAHTIQGIGANFIPENYDPSLVDEVIPVTEQEAFDGARLLAVKEGILVGISSGAAFSIALKQAALPENEGKTVVVLLPDTGERYLSSALFTQQ